MGRASKIAFICLSLAGQAYASDAPPMPEVLPLDDAVARALQRNPNAEVAVEEIHRAQALVEEVRASSLPTLTVNHNYTRLDHDRKFDGATTLPENSLNLSATLAVPILAPRGWVQWWHAKENVDVTRLSADEVRRQLALATARTYLGIVAQHHVLEVAQRAREAARAHYDFAHQRFAGGYGTRVDEVRAAQETAADEVQVQTAAVQLSRLRETLGVLIGVDHPVDVTADVTLPSLPPADELMKDALVRSDVRLGRARLTAARHVMRDDWADYTPTVYGSFTPFYQTPPTSTVPTTGWQAQLVLSWALYDGGLRYGLGHERKSLTREAEIGLDGTVRQAQSDVRTADEEVRLSVAALQAAREAAALADEGLKLTTLAYKEGASTNIEVIDAERQARDAATAVAQAEDAWRQATLDGLIAAGRFPSK